MRNYSELHQGLEEGVLIATTVNYHNLVIYWNTWTLPQGREDLIDAIKHATYHLKNDEATDLSIDKHAPVLGSKEGI